MTILVVGALHLDIVLRAPHLPVLDETVTGREVSYVFGGKGGNQALACARLGADVHFAGRAGSDTFGDILRQTLRDSGIDIAQLQTDAGASGMSAAIVDDSGEYGAVIVSAANLNIDAESIFVPPKAGLVLLQSEVPEAVNIAVARKARAAGARVWLNAAPARALSGDFTALVDLLIVNRVEAEFYDPFPDGLVPLITRGAEGVRYQGRDWPAPKVGVISTHGAGDMFVGALAAFADAGNALEEAIPKAQAAAAWFVSTDAATRETTTPEALAAVLDAQASP